MTKRIPVSGLSNIWFDAQQVDSDDLILEQNHNNQIQSSIINNHLGSGVLLNTPSQNVIYDSSLSIGLLDGIAVLAQSQPSDLNFGNQLELELTNSAVAGRRSVKVCIIGLDFQGNLQYERFTFFRNEKLVTKKHYTQILLILFNDFIGDVTKSFNLGGNLVIREAKAFQLSRDCIMTAQDIEPNLFFRDFFVGGSPGNTLGNLLKTSLPSYNIDLLNISTSYKQIRYIIENDVSSQIGQKFVALTNNIQKITLLLAVQNPSTPSDLSWTGDLVVSVSSLQSTVQCGLDIAPNLAIDFNPSNVPLAQISFNFNTLLATGIRLGLDPQPVDFIFTNTSIANGATIIPGNYYVVTVKRSGSANQSQIGVAVGNDRITNSRVTLFNGVNWIDVQEEDMWFQIWTDAAKVADGQAYDAGNGVNLSKTIASPIDGTTIDNVLDKLSFARNEIYTAVLSANTENSNIIQDQRTGDPVASRKQFVAGVNLKTSSDLATLLTSSEPLKIGTIIDKNVKTFDSSSATVSSTFHAWGMIGNKVAIKIIDDLSDPRYDINVINLATVLLSGGLNGAKFTPNTSTPGNVYKIANPQLLTMILGDVNGDGVVDEADLALAQNYVGVNLSTSPSETIYTQLTKSFVNDGALTYQIYSAISTLLYSNTDGAIVVSPADGSQANFQSSLANFDTITSIGTCTLVVSGSTHAEDNGTFKILAEVNRTNLTIQKLLYTIDKVFQFMRTDIDGNFQITTGDVNYISNYVLKVNPFPAASAPGNKIGSTFKVIRFDVEQVEGREDDFPFSIVSRPTALHPLVDVFANDTTLSSLDYLASPVSFNIIKQFSWKDYFVLVNNKVKSVPVSFTMETGHVDKNLLLNGVISNYPGTPDHDPGRNDIFYPDNIVVGNELVRPDGYYYKVDFEVGTFTLEVPVVNFPAEKSFNIFTDLVCDYNTFGYTRLGYPALRFADSSIVGITALSLNQVRFSVSVQSFSPGVDGYSVSMGLGGIIVDDKIGVSLDYVSGILKLNFSNLQQDPVLQTLDTKIQVQVFLKKAGFNNPSKFVSSDKMKNILGL